LHAADRVGNPAPQHVHQLGFACPDALLGAEYASLVFLELRRHEPLRARERLAPLVVGRHLIEVGPRDLDVVPEHLVEPDLERADAGALALARLQAGDVGLAAVPGVSPLVEAAVLAAPARSGSSSSRLRRVISSRGRTSPRRTSRGRARWGRPPGLSSRA